MSRIESNPPRRAFVSGKTALQSSAVAMLLSAGIVSVTPSVSLADESGTSFWLPGTYGSLAAVPGTPGWAVAAVYYHTSVSAGADVAAAREIQIARFNPALNVNLNANLHAGADLAIVVPSYVFATPVLGGQLAVQMGTIVGSTSANVNGTSFGLAASIQFGANRQYRRYRDGFRRPLSAGVAEVEHGRQQLHDLYHRYSGAGESAPLSRGCYLLDQSWDTSSR